MNTKGKKTVKLIGGAGDGKAVEIDRGDVTVDYFTGTIRKKRHVYVVVDDTAVYNDPLTNFVRFFRKSMSISP